MRLLPCGPHAVLIELDDLAQARALAEALRREPVDGVHEIVPGARTVLLHTDAPPGRIAEQLGRLDLAGGAGNGAEEIEIEVRYDGADLADVARLTGRDEAGVIAAHTGQLWTVAFGGFVPGFGYLVGENDALHVPRRDVPRTTVPAGSVGLAGEFTGAYPRSSPGGWQLIGSTDAPLWDIRRDPPALLRPGVRVRFLDVERLRR